LRCTKKNRREAVFFRPLNALKLQHPLSKGWSLVQGPGSAQQGWRFSGMNDPHWDVFEVTRKAAFGFEAISEGGGFKPA
jgi:hypothetical protein